MNKLIITLLLLINKLIVNHLFAGEINSPQKTITQKENYVFIEGRWKQTTSKGERIIPKINTTKVICDKLKMVCDETIAKLTTPDDDNLFLNTLLYIQEFSYDILSWKDKIIIAKREAPVAEVIINISVDDNHAEKSFRETKARSSRTADPNIFYHWILE